MSERIAILGSSGFVGKNFAEYARDFDKDVACISRDAFGPLIYHDANKLAFSLQGSDVVYNFVATSKPEPGTTFDRTNAETAHAVSEACKKAGVKRLVHLSGLGVAHYGDARHPSVQNKYFESLACAEREIRKSEVEFTIFRPSYIIGPDDLFSLRLIDQIGQGTVAVLGRGSERVQPIYIKDACEILLKTPDFPNAENIVFDLAGPEKIPFVKYVELMADSMNPALKDELTFRAITKGEAVDYYGMSPEQTDIRTCDEVSDHSVLEKTFDIRLKTPKEFLKEIYRR